jgi:hypothetical protein
MRNNNEKGGQREEKLTMGHKTLRLLTISLLAGTLTIMGTSTGKTQLITSIANMGSTTFAVEDESTSASYSQSPTYLEFNGSFLGATLGGLWEPAVPKDWSLYSLSDFGLMLSIQGENPNLPFTIEFYDSSLSIANTFTGNTAGVTTNLTFAPILLSLPGTGNMNEILGIQFTFDGPDNAGMKWESISVVPEPSTYALLTLGSLILTLTILKKRKPKCLSTL